MVTDELRTVVSDVFGGEGPTLEGLLTGVRERAEQRARDALQRQMDSLLPGSGGPPPADPGPAPAAIARQRRALVRLQRSHDALARRVAALERRSDQALVGMLQQIRGIDGRLAAVRVQARELRAAGASVKRLAVSQRRLAVSANLQRVTSVVGSAQSAAYGQKGSVLATSNLLLAGNQLLWGFIEPLLRSVGLQGASPTILASLAPLGALLTGYAVVGSHRQHVRFVSGIATFEPGALSFQESLRSRIGDALWPEFQRRTDVPVTTIAVGPGPLGFNSTGEVRSGVLEIRIGAVLLFGGPPPQGRRVAWMVDTGADGG